jgi:ABC-type Fe3+ transport system substrate-binding protein
MKKATDGTAFPDELREEMDFIGHVYCPFRERFSRAWRKFADAYNAEHSPPVRGVVPLKGGGEAVYNHIHTIRRREKFPAVTTDGGYGDFFEPAFLRDGERLAWFTGREEAPVCPLFRGLDLRDPLGVFNIYGAMPYVLLVNHRRLDGRPVPRRIDALTDSAYRGRVGSIYAPDDISELLLLEIWKQDGAAGIKALAENIAIAGGARELAASAAGGRDPYCVYVMSWFFARAVPRRDYLEVVWPEDGALLSPLYALLRREPTPAQRACAGFVFGADLGRVMAENGFAHVHVDAPHPLPPDAKFRWVGWDYLREKDIRARVAEIEAVYYAHKGAAERTMCN